LKTRLYSHSDPHVVSRVRQFLATPHYLDEGDSHYYNYGSGTVTITTTTNPASPYKTPTGRPSKIRQPNIITTRTSPTRALPVVSSPPGPGPGGDSEPLNPNHISFSDDLFINHSHQQAPAPQNNSTPVPVTTNTKSMIPVRSPTHPAPPPATNGGKNNSNKTHNNSTPVPVSKPKTPPPVAPRKNFEAFVMTGDAILNVSKLRNDDQLRSVRIYDYKSL
jgi:hypothetical protein